MLKENQEGKFPNVLNDKNGAPLTSPSAILNRAIEQFQDVASGRDDDAHAHRASLTQEEIAAGKAKLATAKAAVDAERKKGPPVGGGIQIPDLPTGIGNQLAKPLREVRFLSFCQARCAQGCRFRR